MFKLDKDKLVASAIAAGTFFLVSNPSVIESIGLLNTDNGLADWQGCPTSTGRIVLTIVFFALNMAIMFGKDKMKGLQHDWKQYLKCSAIASILFFVISSPQAYNLTGQVFGKDLFWIEDACPGTVGVGVHSGVYLVLIYVVMLLKDSF